MKYAALIMVFVVLLSLAGVGYMYLTASVSVTGSGVAVSLAADQQEAYDQLKHQLAQDSAAGTRLSAQLPGDAADYKFVTYRVQLKNSTWLDAEAVELQVIPRDGDIHQLACPASAPLSAKGSGIYEITILTHINSYVGREVIVTYYLWGQPFTLRAVCSG